MAETKVETKDTTENLVEQLMEINQLTYSKIPDLNVARNRTMFRNEPQTNTLTNNQTVVFVVQTGDGFVDAMNSRVILNFQVTAGGEATNATNFGLGGITNIIRTVTVKARSGIEVCRIDAFNLWIAKVLRYKATKEWFEQYGNFAGFSAASAAAPTTGDMKTAPVTFGFPLWWIPVFKQQHLIPPQMMSGMRIEFVLEQPTTALKATALVTGYQVTFPIIEFSIINLEDSFMRMVDIQASSETGLTLMHKEVYNDDENSNGTGLNFLVRRPVSIANGAFMVTRLDTRASSGTNDSMASEEFKYTEQQWSIGDSYFPLQPIISTAVVGLGGQITSFLNVLEYMEELETVTKTGDVLFPSQYKSYTTFGAAPPGDTLVSSAIITVCLNKSHISGLSGYVINNSRGLVGRIRYSDVANRIQNIFLHYWRGLTIFKSNIVVSD